MVELADSVLNTQRIAGAMSFLEPVGQPIFCLGVLTRWKCGQLNNEPEIVDDTD